MRRESLIVAFLVAAFCVLGDTSTLYFNHSCVMSRVWIMASMVPPLLAPKASTGYP